jgi:hypothetical protein
MTRRYLLRDEVDGALRRGNSVECFLGSCERAGKPGVRHLSLNLDDGTVVVGLFETQDLGDPAFLDLYEFGPLNDALGLGDAEQTVRFSSLDECLAFMEDHWPGSSGHLINEGVLQDEYADFLAARSAGFS